MYKIRLAHNHLEREEFAQWITAQGHDASIGDSYRNYVGDVWCATDNAATRILVGLWTQYRNDA